MAATRLQSHCPPAALILPTNQCNLQALPSRQASKDKIALQPSTSANMQGVKAIEDIYQKKSQLEHILLRPDTYIGSTEKKEEKLWVHHDDQLLQQEISYAPGLYKIFDEILVNAADNKVRDPKMDTLKVDISAVGFHICNLGFLSNASPCYNNILSHRFRLW